jgi:hypothetical protein
MLKCQLLVCLAATIAVAGQTVSAQVGGLPAEVTTRQAADAQLQTRIDNEATARKNADLALDGRIDAEAVARMQAVDELRRSIGGGTGGGGTVNVDCATGGSVSQALAAGVARIIIRGQCTESVTINRDDVTLQGDAAVGGAIHGPDANTNTVTVTGSRVTIEALTVSGGRNGITGIGAPNLTVRNCTVRSTGRTGIIYANGSSGTVDGCTVQFNAVNGVGADSVSQMGIINSTISNNARNGVSASSLASVRIGFTERFAAAGNTISDNGGSGIGVSGGAVALMAMNQITRNRSFGISVFQATATIVGGNTISDNTGVGVSVNGSKVVLGDTGFGLPSVNRISANGGPSSAGGVVAFLSSSMIVRDAEIAGNNGPGLLLMLRSQGQLSSSTIQNNTGDGIRLLWGSALLPVAGVTTVSGNSGLGLQCSDSESSVINTSVPTILAISANFRGNLSPFCTTFDAAPVTPLPPLPPA